MGKGGGVSLQMMQYERGGGGLGKKDGNHEITKFSEFKPRDCTLSLQRGEELPKIQDIIYEQPRVC